MRIAALAFGILAGLVASFILALGGLDASELPHLDGRQMQLVTFGLFVVANLGVLGAGLVLATPLAGAILFALGAIGWVAAAFAMHHGPDYVMLTPPGILIVATALSVVAFLRRAQSPDADGSFSRRQSAAAQQAAMGDAGTDDETEEDEEDESSGSGVAVGASFFGDAGTATPLRGTMADSRREPVRRRVDPPRQKPVFRDIEEEYEDEESGFSRVARGISSVLSFGLYATLAAAVVLIVWNIRPSDLPKNTATKIEASTTQPKTAAPVLSPSSSSAAPTMAAEAPAAPTLSPTPTASITPELTAPTPPQLDGTSQLAAPASGPVSTAIAEAPPSPPSAVTQPAEPTPLPPGVVVAEAPLGNTTAETPAADATASSTEPQPGDDLAGQGATGPLMPYPMPPEIAAGRPTAAKPRPAAPATTAPRADTGL